LICHMLDNDDTVCSAVVTWCDCSKSSLSSCVPDLQLNCFTVQLYGSDLEIHSDGTDIAFSVSVISESQ
jgi:hypothetical protein